MPTPDIEKLIGALRTYSTNPAGIPAFSMNDLVGENVTGNVFYYLVKNIFSQHLTEDQAKNANLYLSKALSNSKVQKECTIRDANGQYVIDLMAENFDKFSEENVKKIIYYTDTECLTSYRPASKADQMLSRPRSSSVGGGVVQKPLPFVAAKENLLAKLLKQNNIANITQACIDLFRRGMRLNIDDKEANLNLFDKDHESGHKLFYLINLSLLEEGNANFFFYCIEYCARCQDQKMVDIIKKSLESCLNFALMPSDEDTTYAINKAKSSNQESLVAFLLRNKDAMKIAEDLWGSLQKSENLGKFDLSLFAIGGDKGTFLHELINANNINLLEKFFITKARKSSGDELLLGRVLAMRDSQGLTPLHLAAQKGWDNAIGALLSFGPMIVNPEILDNQGNTPLLIAVGKGFVESCKNLLQHADVESRAAKVRPLYKAIKQNSETLVEVLLFNGADPDGVSEVGGGKQVSPLLEAIKNNNYLSVKLLVQYGANIYNERGYYIEEYKAYRDKLQTSGDVEELIYSENIGIEMINARKEGKSITLYEAQQAAEDKRSGVGFLRRNPSTAAAAPLTAQQSELVTEKEVIVSKKLASGRAPK